MCGPPANGFALEGANVWSKYVFCCETIFAGDRTIRKEIIVDDP
jgi:hypothetical protein